MAKKRVTKQRARTAADVAREKTVRLKFQTSRPTLDSLVSSGEYTPAMKQGEYLILMQVAVRLRQAREQRKLSLADLSTLTGIDKAAISRIENGLAENPTIGTISRLARSLGKRLRIELDDEHSVAAQ